MATPGETEPHLAVVTSCQGESIPRSQQCLHQATVGGHGECPSHRAQAQLAQMDCQRPLRSQTSLDPLALSLGGLARLWDGPCLPVLPWSLEGNVTAGSRDQMQPSWALGPHWWRTRRSPLATGHPQLPWPRPPMLEGQVQPLGYRQGHPLLADGFPGLSQPVTLDSRAHWDAWELNYPHPEPISREFRWRLSTHAEPPAGAGVQQVRGPSTLQRVPRVMSLQIPGGPIRAQVQTGEVWEARPSLSLTSSR